MDAVKEALVEGLINTAYWVGGWGALFLAGGIGWVGLKTFERWSQRWDRLWGVLTLVLLVLFVVALSFSTALCSTGLGLAPS